MYSDYLAELVNKGISQGDQRLVSILDCDPAIFKSVLYFMYHGVWRPDLSNLELQSGKELAVKFGILPTLGTTFFLSFLLSYEK